MSNNNIKNFTNASLNTQDSVKTLVDECEELTNIYNSFLLSDIKKSKKISQLFKNQILSLAKLCEKSKIGHIAFVGKILNDIAIEIDPSALINNKSDIINFLDFIKTILISTKQSEKIKLNGIFEAANIFKKSLYTARKKGFKENKETVFVIDEDKDILETAGFILTSGGFNVLKFSSQIEAFNSVSLGNIPDAIILDLDMPKIVGFEMYGALKEFSNYQMIPFIFLTAKDNTNGAKVKLSPDFLLKPFLPDELLTKVNLKIEKTTIFNELIIKDSLTGAYNRRHFFERLQNEINRSVRHNLKFSVIMIDIDDFKKINDSYGHPVGDKVLKFLVQFLISNLRNYDIVSRYGGEEFSLILSEINKENSEKVIQKLCKKFALIPFNSDKCEEMFNSGISAGVAAFPEDGESSEKLIDSADKALYYAKRTGKNKAIAFNAEMM